MNSNVDILLEARNGMADPGQWTKRKPHVTEFRDGQQYDKYCAVGHVWKAICGGNFFDISNGSPELNAKYVELVNLLNFKTNEIYAKVDYIDGIVSVNDVFGRQPALGVFDAVIEDLKNGTD